MIGPGAALTFSLCCAGPTRMCCNWNAAKSANTTGAIGCTCRKPNAPWRNRWSATGSYRPWWCAGAQRTLRTDRRIQASGRGAPSGADRPSFGPADGSRRAHRESRHLRTESRRRPHAGTGRSLDHSSPGARRRHEPGGSGGVAGAAQELGVPAAGADRAAGPKARDELRVGLLSPTAARQIVRLPQGNQAEVLDAIAARSTVGRGTGGRGRSVAGLRRTAPAAVHPGASARSAYRRPRERSRRCTIPG